MKPAGGNGAQANIKGSEGIPWQTLPLSSIVLPRNIMDRKFTLEYWLDENWYVGRIKEVPGVFSQGETLAELELNIFDAYRMIVSEEETGYSPSSEIQYKEVTAKV